MNSLLRVENLTKEYPLPDGVLRVFSDLNFTLESGRLVAVMGMSGVGKTTLLNLFGALDKPTKGKIFIDGEDLLSMTENRKAKVRNEKIGFVFQFYHLLPEFTALENVMLPLLIRGVDKNEAWEKGMVLLDEVSLIKKAPLWPRQLSGGEQQRIAIARSLVNEPKLLLADEPTGNLDWKTGGKILDLIKNLHQKKNLSSIIVTHNENVARFCDDIYIMEDGGMKRFSNP
jgi:ABC-type lipoprotein export system ATPase subunit